MTEAEVLAACLARGKPRAICDEIIASQRVAGVYCDGTIVIDANGRRCVSRELAARAQAVSDASTLPANIAIEPPPPPPSSGWLVLGFGAALVAAVWWATR